LGEARADYGVDEFGVDDFEVGVHEGCAGLSCEDCSLADLEGGGVGKIF
jgi:hypothetical protein